MTDFETLRSGPSSSKQTRGRSEHSVNDDISENTMTTRELREMSDRSSRLFFSSGGKGNGDYVGGKDPNDMPPPPSEVSSAATDDKDELLYGNSLDPLSPENQGQQIGYEQAEDAFYYTSGDEPQEIDTISSSQGVSGDDDATKTVHEMHYALLFLMSNPEELQTVIAQQQKVGGGNDGVYKSWADEETHNAALNGENLSYTNGPLLPYVVFAPDAEVVLPQAHTASQLFGIEQVDGIELEAAAGIPALCQLFLRWLGKWFCKVFVDA